MKALLLTVLLLSGCAILGEDRTAEDIASAVSIYCIGTQESRTEFRKKVNDLTAPNSILVTCENY